MTALIQLLKHPAYRPLRFAENLPPV